MAAYSVEWLMLLARWFHLVAGVAWIGASFYFIWLDNHLEVPADPADQDEGIGGELWAVHGGGFYNARKFTGAPKSLPETLHWFKWEAYTTWLSGMLLLALVYWYGANVYLIDPRVAELSQVAAVLLSVGFIGTGWLVYDLLCRSKLGDDQRVLGVILFLLVCLLAWGLCQLFSGRGAYIHFGTVLGTIMVANVFFVIIPGQRRMVDAAARGDTPDARDGERARQRSVHNTYFTLPVLFVMISNHYSMTYDHGYNWLILIGISLAGALIRVYFVARHAGSASPWPIAVALFILFGVFAATTPRTGPVSQHAASFDQVREVVAERCVSCHASQPSHPAFPAAPGGVRLDTDASIRAEAARIYQQSVTTHSMPIGNLTGMTDAERALIGNWYEGLEGRDDG